jgi:CIC family chloride channel protein
MLLPDAEKCKRPLSTLLQYQNVMLTPEMNIREAARRFEQVEAEALAVVDPGDKRVLGLLTEAHVLRRYTEELDKVRKDLSGEAWLGET